MNHRPTGHITLQRLMLLAAAVSVAAFGWILLGKAETAIADETEGVLARVNGIAITEAEVTESASAQLQKVERERHEILEQATRARVDEKLLEVEAKSREMSVEELLEKEVNAKVAPVTDEDIEAFYNERKQQIGNRTLEQIGGQIRAYLERSRPEETRQSFIGSLRDKHKIEMLIDPFRVQVAMDGPSKGPANAPVKIVEFSDFECPFCGRVNPTIDQIREKYKDKVQIVFRQFPLTNIHPNAFKAGEASLCAHDQGKFWELHDAMFEDRANLKVADLKAKAVAIELDADQFNDCLDSGKYESTVSRDLEEGSAAGVSGTPAFFINGRFLSGAAAFETFAEIIDDELRRAGG